MASIKSVVETVTNIAILLVIGVFAWVFVIHKPFWKNSSSDDKSLVGEYLSAPAGYVWRDHPKTLLIAIRHDCKYCRASMPFYKKLSELRRQHQLNTALIAVMPDETSSEKSFLQENGVTLDSLFSEPLDSVKVDGTPTLMMLNSAGRIEQEWIGKMSSKQENEVISAVSR